MGETRDFHRPSHDRSRDGRRPPARAPKPRDVDIPRRVAFDALVAVESRDAFANLILPSMLRDKHLTGRDAAFVTEMVYGTLRNRGFLDAVIAAASDRPLKEVDPRVVELLRLGSYQLLFMRVPAHAAVAATVSVAQVAVTEGPARFVNAILRRVSEKTEDEWRKEVVPEAAEDPILYGAVAYSHPEWIVRAYDDALQHDLPELMKALESNNIRPEVHLAARPGLIDHDALVEMVRGTAGEYSPYAVRISGGDPGKIPAVRDGRAHVQDEGSQLAALSLINAPVEGSDAHWLDLCAGPGGKAALLGAIAAQRSVSVTAVEINERRAELVRRAVGDLPVTVLATDGRTVGETTPSSDSGDSPLHEAAFDRVLVDAPCTGLGSLRRRPEARWRKQPSDIPPLTRLQRELLAAGIRAARPGGVIAYVVCTPHVAETRVIVADALRKGGIEQLDARPYFADMPDLGEGPAVQLWPHRHGTDAMFVALLRRV